MKREVIAVSACLLGIACKYNGGHNLNLNVLKYIKGMEVVPICPEVFGELGTPRIPSEIQISGKILNKDGFDVTDSFELGMTKSLELLNNFDCKKAILKDGSPSCGYKMIYDGTFTGVKIPGKGITANNFIQNNIKIIDIET